MDKITYEISEMNNGVIIECIASVDKAQVCECKVSVDKSLWTISSWFTKPGYKGKGIGKNTMKTTLNHILKTYGVPEKIEYIWNGANSYVLEWLEKNFDAVCTCPIAVQKLLTEDDWSSHIYELNAKKVLSYFEL